MAGDTVSAVAGTAQDAVSSIASVASGSGVVLAADAMEAWEVAGEAAAGMATAAVAETTAEILGTAGTLRRTVSGVMAAGSEVLEMEQKEMEGGEQLREAVTSKQAVASK